MLQFQSLLADCKEIKAARLDVVRDRLSARQPKNEATTDEQHRQGRDEGRHAQDNDQNAVD